MAYKGVFVFGDSLVDAGNALELAEWYGTLTFSDLPEGAPSADLGYFKGRFSDGYTFADLIANKAVGQVTKPIFPFDYEDPWIGIPIAPWAGDPGGKTLNFAYGGAQIRQGGEVVPDLDGQTDAFKDAVDDHADPNALYIFTIGGNDVRSLAPAGSDPTPQAEAYAALDACADKMLREISQLVDIGVHNILLTGIPDVGIIPKYDRNGDGALDPAEQVRADAATDYSAYLDALLRSVVIPAVEALGATVTYVPLMDQPGANGTTVDGAVSAILPELAALHGLTAAELENNLLAHQELLFFDQVHPNAQAQALVAAYSLARVNGTPWVEILPLTGLDVDFRAAGSIGATGEVDRYTFSLVAGSTYTLEMLGVSSTGAKGAVGDSVLRLLSPAGVMVASDDDSGAGLDARISFTAATSGLYTLELSAPGVLTGDYVLGGALAGGTALQSGTTYTVSSPSVVILEGADGLGQDIVRSSASYTLAAGCAIEVLRTTNDKGKTALNLTGNEYAQALVGNNGANRLEGREGADSYTGGAGADTFVLSASALTSAGTADSILDYARGDVVDASQVLKLAAGVNPLSGGYLRVTSSGLIQVDMDGGGNGWQTLSTVNGTGAVDVRYLSGGTASTVSVARVPDTMSAALVQNDHQLMSHHSDWMFG